MSINVSSIQTLLFGKELYDIIKRKEGEINLKTVAVNISKKLPRQLQSDSSIAEIVRQAINLLLDKLNSSSERRDD